MGALWTSYRPPANDREATPVINVWRQFFGKLDGDYVANTIMSIAAEGGEFPPQVGQIYARIKADLERKRLKEQERQDILKQYERLKVAVRELQALPAPEIAQIADGRRDAYEK